MQTSLQPLKGPVCSAEDGSSCCRVGRQSVRWSGACCRVQTHLHSLKPVRHLLQGLKRDCELEGNMLLAQRNAGGWLPLQALLHTKLIRAALKAKHPALDLRDAQACHQLLVLDHECKSLT